jgi:hypothetical protein
MQALEEMHAKVLEVLSTVGLDVHSERTLAYLRGRPGFRMRDGGRVLLGLPRDGLPDRDEEEAGAASELVVQPNFEIVFLSPSAAAEAVLGRFCERVGREVGVLFRLTRQSLLRAAAAGLETEQVLATLTQGSRNPLPPNVEHEIRGWMGAVAP